MMWLIDFGDADGTGLWELWTGPQSRDVFLGLGEVIIAVVGIAMTVVAILVQLAAYRYSPRITEIFLRDPVNLIAIGWLVINSVLVLWVALSMGGTHHPELMTFATILGVSIALLGLLPYFAYVFFFLSPGHIVSAIRADAAAPVTRLLAGKLRVRPARRLCVDSIEHLSQMAQTSVKNDDERITMLALEALTSIVDDHLEQKSRLPAGWFEVDRFARDDQDLIALHPRMIASLTARRTWFEMKVLRTFDKVFRQALGRLPDVGHLVAIHTRRVAESAVQHHDDHALKLTLRFFNTYLRHAVNGSDARTAYNVLNEYRLLTLHLLEASRGDDVIEAAERIAYYTALAFDQHQNFIVETAAHDLGQLLEAAFLGRFDGHAKLLHIFLQVDREPFDGHERQEASLRGVRKAHIKLAAFYLANGAEEHARSIADDMSEEPPERLRSLREELEGIREEEWWEVANRDTNWDYVPEDHRVHLNRFFEWFPQLQGW